MKNATDTRDFIVAGFAELIAFLETEESSSEAAKKRQAERTAEERASSVARVRGEYRAACMPAPHALALSLTARRQLGGVFALQATADLDDDDAPADVVPDHETDEWELVNE